MDNRAYAWRGLLRLFLVEPRGKLEGLDDVRESHRLNPNDAMTLIMKGFGEALCGDPASGRRDLFAAMRLNPRDPWHWNTCNCLGMVGFLAKDYAWGLEWAQRSLGEQPHFMSAHYHAMLNAVGLGRLDLARAEVDAICQAAPEVYERMFVRRSCVYLDPEHHHRAVVFARVAAGLENPEAADPLR